MYAHADVTPARAFEHIIKVLEQLLSRGRSLKYLLGQGYMHMRTCVFTFTVCCGSNIWEHAYARFLTTIWCGLRLHVLRHIHILRHDIQARKHACTLPEPTLELQSRCAWMQLLIYMRAHIWSGTHTHTTYNVLRAVAPQKASHGSVVKRFLARLLRAYVGMNVRALPGSTLDLLLGKPGKALTCVCFVGMLWICCWVKRSRVRLYALDLFLDRTNTCVRSYVYMFVTQVIRMHVCMCINTQAQKFI